MLPSCRGHARCSPTSKTSTPRPYPDFGIRTGEDISPQIAIQNILEALRSSAAGFGLDAPSSRDGTQVIADLELDQLIQFRRWLHSTYEIKQSRSTPSDYGPDLYFENLRLEMLGHRDVYLSRKELAMLRLVRFGPALPSSVASDCLRLLRLAGADSELRRLVNDLTLAGPVSSLLADGRRIDAHRISTSSLRTGEMIVLAAAAEVVTPPEAFRALNRVLSVIRGGSPTTAPRRWQADFSKDQEAWAAAAALAAAAGTSGAVARDLLAYATPERLADIASDTVIARIVRTIEWADIDDDLRERWLSLASTQAATDPRSPTSSAIRHALDVSPELQTSSGDNSLSGYADRINYYLRNGRPIPDQLRQESKRAALSSLARIGEDASAGKLVRRATNPAEIVAVVLTQSSDRDAWAGLLEFFVNPIIARSDKARALDILARERPSLVPDLSASYAQALLSLIDTPDNWAFDDPQRDAVFVSALNFAYVYGLLSEGDAVEYLGKLASSQDVEMRRHAARSLSLLASTAIRDWMLPKVYALSGDSDPTVRVAVARALGEICQRDDVVGDMAVERLGELLRSGGVYVPLQTLLQLPTKALTRPQIDRIVRQLRNENQSWRIRKRAAQLAG